MDITENRININTTIMNLEEIKQAISEGKTVNWSNSLYKVINPHNGEYLILCTANNHAIGLTHRDGVTMNGDEKDFFVNNEK